MPELSAARAELKPPRGRAGLPWTWGEWPPRAHFDPTTAERYPLRWTTGSTTPRHQQHGAYANEDLIETRRAIAALLFAVVVVPRFVDHALAQDYGTDTPAPEFTHSDPQAWINSAPLRIEDLRGKVVLLDIWTYDCWNCYRSFPWLKQLEARFAGGGLQIIGIHTPEFDHERIRDNVVEKVAEFALPHPVMMDNDFSYWKALRNRYWPSYYLIDKQGNLRARFVGETHAGTDRARKVEAAVATLLEEQ